MKTKIIKVVLQGYIQTGMETFTNVYKAVDIEIPDDGMEWHVAGEMEALNDGNAEKE